MSKKSEAGLGFYVRFPDAQTRNLFKVYAKSQSRSMNGQVIEMVRKAIRKHTPSKANLPTPGDK